jgi:hypothetical protein
MFEPLRRGHLLACRRFASGVFICLGLLTALTRARSGWT